VIELVDHLRLVEREKVFARLRLEKARRAGHVEEPLHEMDTPWVLFQLGRGFLPDENWDPAIDPPGEFRIGAAAEDRAGEGVWIDQEEVFCSKAEAAVLIKEMISCQ
jgi:cytochrome oxidase assembly protein ShyY1